MEKSQDSGEFRFRQFAVRHDRCGMKVGTDGILLGAWADVSGARAILDVGTGCGLVALMLAQRNGFAQITAVELDPDAANQATENVAGSPWGDRIRVINLSFQDFLAGAGEPTPKFDRIVSNPPYFQGQIETTTSARQVARHAVGLTPEDFVTGAAMLLEPAGKLALILPVDLAGQVVQQAASNGLHLQRHTGVQPRPDLPPKRVLLEFGFRKAVTPALNSLVVENAKHVYSEAWKELTGEFYLESAGEAATGK